jgi:hypothetical protein
MTMCVTGPSIVRGVEPGDSSPHRNPSTNDHGPRYTGPPLPKRDAIDLPIRSALRSDSRYAKVEVRNYHWNQPYTAADYGKLMLSYCGTQLMEPSADRRCSTTWKPS